LGQDADKQVRHDSLPLAREVMVDVHDCIIALGSELWEQTDLDLIDRRSTSRIDALL
jgi:hypothetical protein